MPPGILTATLIEKAQSGRDIAIDVAEIVDKVADGRRLGRKRMRVECLRVIPKWQGPTMPHKTSATFRHRGLSIDRHW